MISKYLNENTNARLWSTLLVLWTLALLAESTDPTVLFAYLSLGKLVDKLILWRGVDHPPALLSHFSDLVEDWDILVIGHQQPNEGHHHESSSPSHSRTTVHDRNIIFLDILYKLIHQLADPLFVLLLGDFSIQPVKDLEMCDDMTVVGVFVGELYFSDLYGLLGVVVVLFH